MSPLDSGRPWVGPRPYRIEDSALFFGREVEAGEVADRWLEHRLMVIHGASGVGKTSFIQAGVIPRVRRGEADVLPPGRLVVSTCMPTAAVTAANPYTFALLMSWSPDDPPARLSSLSIAEYLLRRREATLRHGPPRPLLAVIDRFEDVLRGRPRLREYQEQFVGQLAEAVRRVPELRLLLSLRDDWLPSLAVYEARLAPGARIRYRLPSLSAETAADALAKALGTTGRSFAAGAARHLVDDLADADLDTARANEPEAASAVDLTQLQLVFAELCEGLPPASGDVTTADLPSRAEVDQILASFVAEVVAEISRVFGVAEGRLRRWLRQTFVTDLGTRDAAYENADGTAGMSNAIVRAFEDYHLLRAEWRRSARWHELAHDRWLEVVRQAGLLPTHRSAAAITPLAGLEDDLVAAEAAFREGELSLALARAQEALRLADGDPRAEAEAESFLGNLAYREGRLRQAQNHYRRAAERFELLRDTGSVGLLLAAIGRLLLQAGETAEALGDLYRATARLPGDRTVRIELARALRHTGQLRGAMGVYCNVLESDPAETNALVERAQVSTELGEFSAALDDLDSLERIDPELAARGAARSARALALARTGLIDKATEEAAAAVEVEPDSGPVLARAAAVSAQAGAVRQALDLADRALAANSPELLPYQAAAARLLVADLSTA